MVKRKQQDKIHFINISWKENFPKLKRGRRSNMETTNKNKQGSIPKIIHYCWFGGKPLPADLQKCVDLRLRIIGLRQFIPIRVTTKQDRSFRPQEMVISALAKN